MITIILTGLLLAIIWLSFIIALLYILIYTTDGKVDMDIFSPLIISLILIGIIPAAAFFTYIASLY